MCSTGSNWQYAIIGPSKDLAPNRWQVFIWTSDGLDYWYIYASLGLYELNWNILISAQEGLNHWVWEMWLCNFQTQHTELYPEYHCEKKKPQVNAIGFIDDRLTLVKAPSHYLNQCWQTVEVPVFNWTDLGFEIDLSWFKDAYTDCWWTWSTVCKRNK